MNLPEEEKLERSIAIAKLMGYKEASHEYKLAWVGWHEGDLAIVQEGKGGTHDDKSIFQIIQEIKESWLAAIDKTIRRR